ncbi:hypothetical protein ACFFTM_00590 [Pseudoduganella plicata]|uniref:Uncharacterized protein n=1 Tax=Pseudoduganella plicata TaxID=321984 RepID=A0ABX5SAL2_9BURK|nr:hypothetical protein [Pseudoduganella plicata]QBQ36531.1 hypothetical protein E1742_10440 [Pseudoduganella plicata]
MYTAKLDLQNGLIFVNSAPIVVDENGILVTSITKLCSPPFEAAEGRTCYRLLHKVSIFGRSADLVIEVGQRMVCAVAFLFDYIEFFESSILESKTLKAFEKSLNVKFLSDHPSTAILEFSKWGQAKFFYDHKQGDLSLDIIFIPDLRKHAFPE